VRVWVSADWHAHADHHLRTIRSTGDELVSTVGDLLEIPLRDGRHDRAALAEGFRERSRLNPNRKHVRVLIEPGVSYQELVHVAGLLDAEMNADAYLRELDP